MQTMLRSSLSLRPVHHAASLTALLTTVSLLFTAGVSPARAGGGGTDSATYPPANSINHIYLYDSGGSAYDVTLTYDSAKHQVIDRNSNVVPVTFTTSSSVVTNTSTSAVVG